MYFFFNIIMMLFLTSCIMFSTNYKNILLNLIYLEFMIMNTIFSMYLIFMMLKFNFNFMYMFFTLVICEGALGLTLLVYMIRNTGNDYLKTLNLLKW